MKTARQTFTGLFVSFQVASPRENSSNETDDVEAFPSSGLAETSHVPEQRAQYGDDKSVKHDNKSAGLQTDNRLHDDDHLEALTPTAVVYRKRLDVPENAEMSNRIQRWRHSDGHLIDDVDIVTQVGVLLKQPRQLCVAGSTFHFPSPMHAVMLQYQGLSTPVNVYADPSFDVTSSWYAHEQRREIPKQLRRSVSNATTMQPRPLKTPQRSSSLFIPRGRLTKFNFNRRATTSFNGGSVPTKLDADDRTLREQCGTSTDSDVSLVRSCSDASSCSHECSHLKVVFDDGKVACVHSDSVSRKNVMHTGSLRSDVSYGSTGSSQPDASSSDEDKASLSPACNVFADNEERTTFAWDFISCSLESFAEMRDTDV